jgi:hypothetical protein
MAWTEPRRDVPPPPVRSEAEVEAIIAKTDGAVHALLMLHVVRGACLGRCHEVYVPLSVAQGLRLGDRVIVTIEKAP